MELRIQTEMLIRGIAENRARRRRKLAMFTALAVLTGGNICWALREIGIASTEEQLCTLEEHRHSAECYDDSGGLICGQEFHVHTAKCCPNELADTETPDIWEMSLPEQSGLARREQAALIAESQIGYTESSRNFIPDEAGERHGYTRYGAWYGSPYGEWNTMFTYFCMYYAGVTAEEMPYGGNAHTWQVRLADSGLLHPPETVPERGDVILLDADADGAADRTGIITGAGEMLTVIEGDREHAVAEVQYAPDDAQILGYAAFPEPEAITVSYSAVSPSGIQVYALADSGTFPDDTVINVRDVSRAEAVQAAEAHMHGGQFDAVAVDISFVGTDGTELEPADGQTVQVQITLPENMQLPEGEYALLHVTDRGAVQQVAAETISGEGAEFSAESFSLYVLTSNVAVNKDIAIMMNGSRGYNSQSNPFVIGVGETLEVWYDGNDFWECSFTVSGNDFADNVHRLVRDYSFANWSDATGFDKIEDNKRKARFIGSTASQDGDNCYIAVRKNGQDVERLYVRVAEHAVFMQMSDNRRLLLNDALHELYNYQSGEKFINANVGDVITLSVNGYHYDAFSVTQNGVLSMPWNNDSLYSEGNTYIPFTCETEGEAVINADGEEIRVFVGNPPYIVNGSDRELLDDYLHAHFGYNSGSDPGNRVIYAYTGDTYTISVNGYAEHLISMPNDAVISKQGNTQYADGNTNITFRCDQPGTTHIEFRNRVSHAAERTVTVVVREHSDDIYMLHGSDRLPIEEVLHELNKYDYREPLTIYALEGETFTLSLDGYDAYNLAHDEHGNYEGAYDLSEYLHRGAPYYQDGNTYVDFTCLKHTGGTTFYVKGRPVNVIIRHPMYVKTAIMDRDIDRVNEWVSSQDWLTKQNGYVPNAMGNYPYQLYDGDTFTLRVPKSDLSAAYLELANPDVLEIVSGQLTPEGDEIQVTFRVHNQTANDIDTTVVLKDGNQTVRTMFVKVIPKENKKVLDHADIEIADGGIYTLTKIIRHTDGTVEKIITQYEAYVNEVNRSTLYQKNGEPCVFYRGNGSPDDDISAGIFEGVHGYESVDYWKDERIQPGDTQYEYTSKYKMDENGNVTEWSIKKYFANDVDYAVFDTNLMLIPDKFRTILYNADGSIASESALQAVSDQTPRYLNNIKFTMNHQDVLDAYNKCPNHTGLDFTIMAYSALVEFDLNKELTGGTVAENQFTFELLQKDVLPLRTWMDGTVTQSVIDQYAENELQFKGAYRILYNENGETRWGSGIDGEAVMQELQGISGYEWIQTPDDVLNRAAMNNDETVIRVLQQYLTESDPVITETDAEQNTVYRMGHDGFYLLSFESEPLQEATNDSGGTVIFDALHFEKGGTYNYIIREKMPERAGNILCDRKEIDLQIEVSEAEKQLTADITSNISNLFFVNHTTFRMPDTGGTGTLPFMFGGMAIMVGAVLLLLRSRRKEAV